SAGTISAQSTSCAAGGGVGVVDGDGDGDAEGEGEGEGLPPCPGGLGWCPGRRCHRRGSRSRAAPWAAAAVVAAVVAAWGSCVRAELAAVSCATVSVVRVATAPGRGDST